MRSARCHRCWTVPTHVSIPLLTLRQSGPSGDSVGSAAERHAGSVFVPSKQLLAQMRFRPWNGVFLHDEYLASVDAAESLTAQLLGEYHAAGVVPLVESRVATDAQLQSAMQLLSAACGVPAENLLGGDTQRDAPAKRRAS